MTPIQREHLDLIRRTYGALRPEDVLQDARNPNSPLHDCFVWDDSVAAEAYRMIQARQVVRIAVRFLKAPEAEPQRVRITYSEQTPQPQTITQDAPDELFRMNLRESELTVQIHTLSQEREYLKAMMRETAVEGDDFASERYAIDLFVRGVPMEDIVEVTNFSAEGKTFVENDVARWINRYGGRRPRRWSAKLAKEEWDADQGENFGGVFGVPPFKPPTRVSVGRGQGPPATVTNGVMQQ